MDLQQTPVMNFDPNSAMGQFVQAQQNALQNFQLPQLQQMHSQGHIQVPAQQVSICCNYSISSGWSKLNTLRCKYLLVLTRHTQKNLVHRFQSSPI